MKAHPDLVREADENFIASFRKLLAEHVPQGETQEAGSVFSFITGLPLSLFNGCVVTRKRRRQSWLPPWRGLRHATSPFARGSPRNTRQGLADVPISYGLERDPSLYPGMVLHPITQVQPQRPGVEVVLISEPRLDEHINVLEEGGLSAESAHRLISPSFAADADVRLFVGRLDGRPVGTSIAIRSRDASGVYNVGTLPIARRRGVGSALTWAAVEAGRAWGYDTIVLQSSVMGLSMYSDMGFRTVAPYVAFAESSVG